MCIDGLAFSELLDFSDAPSRGKVGESYEAPDLPTLGEPDRLAAS